MDVERKEIWVDPNKLRILKVIHPVRRYSLLQPADETLDPIQGIRKYEGPYDVHPDDARVARDFDKVKMWAFFPKDYPKIGLLLDELLTYLTDGYVAQQHKEDIDFLGLKDEFKIAEVAIATPVKNRTRAIPYVVGKMKECLEEYGIIQEMEKARRLGYKPIAIIGGPSHRITTMYREYYLEAKRIFTNDVDVACQYASYYTLKEGYGILYQIEQRRPIGYALWNLALDIYGKLGGLAWTVLQIVSAEADKVIDLTFGIRFSKPDKQGYCAGYVTIIDRFGRLVGVVTAPQLRAKGKRLKGMWIPRENMAEVVARAIDYVKSDPRMKDILKQRAVNIVFHKPFGFVKDEILGIHDAIEEIEYSHVGLVAIVERPGLWGYELPFEGMLEGRCVALNDEMALIQTMTSMERYVHPIACVVYEWGPFKSLSEVCNHILALTKLHWQTVIPHVRLPASLEFAHKVARMYGYEIQPKEGSELWRTLWFI